MRTLNQTRLNDNQIVWLLRITLSDGSIIRIAYPATGISLSGNLYQGGLIVSEGITVYPKTIDAAKGGIGTKGAIQFSIRRFSGYYVADFAPSTAKPFLDSALVEFGFVYEGATLESEITWQNSYYVQDITYDNYNFTLFCPEEIEFYNFDLPYYKVQNEIDNGISYYPDAPESNLGMPIPITYGDFTKKDGELRPNKSPLASTVLTNETSNKIVIASHGIYSFGTINQYLSDFDTKADQILGKDLNTDRIISTLTNAAYKTEAEIFPVNVYSATSLIFTVETETDVLVLNKNHNWLHNQTVRLETSGTLPGGLSENTTYYVIVYADNMIKLSASYNGSAIDITSSGSGTHYVKRYMSFSALGSLSLFPTKIGSLSDVNDFRFTNKGLEDYILNENTTISFTFDKDKVKELGGFNSTTLLKVKFTVAAKENGYQLDWQLRNNISNELIDGHTYTLAGGSEEISINLSDIFDLDTADWTWDTLLNYQYILKNLEKDTDKYIVVEDVCIECQGYFIKGTYKGKERVENKIDLWPLGLFKESHWGKKTISRQADSLDNSFQASIKGRYFDYWIQKTWECASDYTTNIINAWGGYTNPIKHHWHDNQPVRLSTAGTLPGGLSTGITYYTKIISDTALKLLDRPNGSEINITNNGSGIFIIYRYVSGLIKGSLIENPVYLIESLYRDEIFTERDLTAGTCSYLNHVLCEDLQGNVDDYYQGSTFINVTSNETALVKFYNATTHDLELETNLSEIATGHKFYLTNIQADSKIDTSSFDKAAEKRAGWKFAACINKTTDLNSLINKLCQESHLAIIG